MIIRAPKLSIRDKMFVRVVRNGKVVQTYGAKNIITDEGLTALRTNTVAQLVNNLVVGSPGTDVSFDGSAQPLASDTAFALHDFGHVQCFPIIPDWQPSIIEGWTTQNGSVADVTAVDEDYFLYHAWTRTRLGERDELFSFGKVVGEFSREPDFSSPQIGGRHQEIAWFGFLQSVGLAPWSEMCDEEEVNVPGHVATNLWNRGLFRDPEGNPGVIEWPPDDTQFFFEYTVLLFIHPEPFTQVVDINGQNHTFTTRSLRPDQNHTHATLARNNPANFGAWDKLNTFYVFGDSNTMPDLLDGPDNTQTGNPTTRTVTPGDPGENHVDITLEVQAGSLNFTGGGLGNLQHGPWGGNPALITTFDPKIPKDADHKMLMTIRYEWDRAGGDDE